MSIITSKPAKKDNLVDLLFVFFALTLVLFVLVPSNGNLFSSIRTAPGTLDDNSMPADIPDGKTLSFAADQQYWNANCSHGWSSYSRCNTIVARAQSCSISMKSAYCSEYEKYMQQYLDK